MRGVGDFVGFNPQTASFEGERPLFYCSHEPFGHVQIADSFEDWVRKMKLARDYGADTYEEALTGGLANKDFM